MTDLAITAATPASNPSGDASIAAAAMHLMLATHAELENLPIVWQIDLDTVIRPFVAVDHPGATRATRLLAAALELPITISRYTDPNGTDSMSLSIDGRWGGASWRYVAYVRASAYDAALAGENA